MGSGGGQWYRRTDRRMYNDKETKTTTKVLGVYLSGPLSHEILSNNARVNLFPISDWRCHLLVTLFPWAASLGHRVTRKQL